jgi:hypothetical protein
MQLLRQRRGHHTNVPRTRHGPEQPAQRGTPSPRVPYTEAASPTEAGPLTHPRARRRPIVTRKNAYGSRNEEAARLAARVWTATATAEMADLNVLTYLTAYLDACGRNGGKPLAGQDLERFQPWNAVPADLRARAQPPPPG